MLLRELFRGFEGGGELAVSVVDQKPRPFEGELNEQEDVEAADRDRLWFVAKSTDDFVFKVTPVGRAIAELLNIQQQGGGR